MSGPDNKAPPPPSWPSIDDAKPDEDGGSIARAGFNYQDEIAVCFLLQMLEDSTLTQTHLETHDDIVLVRQLAHESFRRVEYVQVKGSEQQRLWSVADLCKREGGKPGTSILERSLARDKLQESSTFRLVTLRPVVSALKYLSHELSSPVRAPDTEGMKELQADITNRLASVTSPKGNNTDFWLRNCLWDERHDETTVRKSNLLQIITLSICAGRTLLPEQAGALLDELRAWAKKAADAKWLPDKAIKVISRIQLLGWWKQRLDELKEAATEMSGGNLTAKMEEAGLSDDLIRLAIELRREYAAEARAPRYMESDDAERLRRRVQSEVSSLRSRFVAGQLPLEPPGFHSLCVERMDELNGKLAQTQDDQSAFLKGCMYDIADRCLLRFNRPS